MMGDSSVGGCVVWYDVLYGRCSSVWPLVLPAPLVSSWAFARAVAALLMVNAALYSRGCTAAAALLLLKGGSAGGLSRRRRRRGS